MTAKKSDAAVLGFSGFSGSGKTTLIEKLIPVLKKKGLKLAVIKHDGHDFDMDKEGKDTYRFARAGADTVLISSVSKSARLSVRPMSLEEMLSDGGDADLILVEGYKYADIPRIGVTSSRTGYELAEKAGVYRAIACDDTSRFDDISNIPVFDLNDAAGISEWIISDIISADDNKAKSDALTHFDPEGNARMVNVGEKDITVREAVAGARVVVNRTLFDLIKKGGVKKGDVLTVAQIAGIMGAKRTPDLIPMCHPIMIDGVDVRLKLNEDDTAIDIEASVKCTGRTGVEMEALTACSIAALTVYDMCKSVQRDIVISNIHLLRKSGGESGDYEK
ncbi:MAG: cyclic pyranopterin monophosphate synthase MoaC [Lachnospiraceae bacterium]|nr:cyclic pyranopterin monophosphate synthase MoaC [Lachnospiraceae bacterium]